MPEQTSNLSAHAEKVAIGRAIEAEMSNRRGLNQYAAKELVGNCPQVVSGEKTRDLAAKKAGLGSARQYRRSESIVDNGAPEVIKAVDEKRMTVNEASKIVHLNHAAHRASADRSGCV